MDEVKPNPMLLTRVLHHLKHATLALQALGPQEGWAKHPQLPTLAKRLAEARKAIDTWMNDLEAQSTPDPEQVPGDHGIVGEMLRSGLDLGILPPRVFATPLVPTELRCLLDLEERIAHASVSVRGYLALQQDQAEEQAQTTST